MLPIFIPCQHHHHSLPAPPPPSPSMAFLFIGPPPLLTCPAITFTLYGHFEQGFAITENPTTAQSILNMSWVIYGEFGGASGGASRDSGGKEEVLECWGFFGMGYVRKRVKSTGYCEIFSASKQVKGQRKRGAGAIVKLRGSLQHIHGPLPWSVCECLKIEQIGIGQLHWSTTNYATMQELALWDGVVAMNEKGIVKGVGVSNYGPNQLLKIHDYLKERGLPLCSAQIFKPSKDTIEMLKGKNR